MKQRIITGAVLTALMLIFFFISKYNGVVLLFEIVIILLSAIEIDRAFKPGMNEWEKIFMLLISYMGGYGISQYPVFVAAVLICMIIWTGYVICNKKCIVESLNFNEVAATALLIVISIFFFSMGQLRKINYGLIYVILAFAVCVLNDVFAFLVGSHCGKNKLCPHISPNKTVEGSVSGAIISIIIIYSLFSLAPLKLNKQPLIFYLILGSVVGQLGDLFFSYCKRLVGIKDFGNILPGHGGILDRFDSAIFEIPFTYVLIMLIGGWIL